MSFVEVEFTRLKGISREEREEIGEKVRRVALKLSVVGATLGEEELRLKITEGRDLEEFLPRIDVVVCVPYHPSRESYLEAVRDEIAEILDRHYANIRVILEGERGGSRVETSRRINYARD